MLSLSSRLLHRLNDVVRLPSVSSTAPELDMSNQYVIDYLAEQFANLGFSCEIVPCKQSGKVNLIASKGTGPGGLVLAGHTDTVPFDKELWSVDPFCLTEKDNRLYGLGVTDMKGFFPVVMSAIEALDAKVFKQPLIILATADEETSMEGARTIAELGRPRARAAVIGEPTGLKPVMAHKGMMMDEIRLLGQSGHSSDPSLGNNAMEAMHYVISDLMRYREELKSRYQSSLFDIPYPTLNLGSIHGGDNPNRICGHCNLQFDMRLMPGMHLEEVRADIRERVHTIVDPLGIEFEHAVLFNGVPAFFAEENSELLETVESLTGHTGISVGFGTEGPFLQQLGMDTIIMGPGNIDQAHQPDEYVSMDMLEPAIAVMQKLIVKYCEPS
ncbi:MAG: acetylornithine deacetylase [Gammaproteobacteria bacterium]|nr:acetylornithine deacetylase [Gammaproteobacteria bacterium]